MVWNGKTQVGLGQFHSARLAAAAYTRCRAAVEREGVTETASLQQLATQVRDGAAAAERAAERPPPPPHASGRGCGEEDPYYGQGELAGEGDPGPRVVPDGDPLLASLHGVRLHRSTESNTGYACVRQVWHTAVGPPLPWTVPELALNCRPSCPLPLPFIPPSEAFPLPAAASSKPRRSGAGRKRRKKGGSPGDPSAPPPPEDCGECLHCLDKPKFGGPGRLRHACVLKAKGGLRPHAAKRARADVAADDTAADGASSGSPEPACLAGTDDGEEEGAAPLDGER